MDGVFSAEVATDAIQKSRDAKQPFVSYIIKQRLVSAHRAASAAAEEFGLPLLDLDAIPGDTLPKEIISDALISKHHILPLMKRDNRLFVAVADPTNMQGIDEIKFQT
ncbi:MAG: type IV-A pilus assembly ATPase PilB, partial [Oceanospirillales bacterium]